MRCVSFHARERCTLRAQSLRHLNATVDAVLTVSVSKVVVLVRYCSHLHLTTNRVATCYLGLRIRCSIRLSYVRLIGRWQRLHPASPPARQKPKAGAQMFPRSHAVQFVLAHVPM